MLIRIAVMELVMYRQSDCDNMLVLCGVRTFQTRNIRRPTDIDRKINRIDTQNRKSNRGTLGLQTVSPIQIIEVQPIIPSPDP